MGDRLAHRHTLCLGIENLIMLAWTRENPRCFLWLPGASTCSRDNLPDYWACGSCLEYKSYEVDYLNLHINIQKLRQGKPHEATSHLSQDYSFFFCPHYYIAHLSMLKRKFLEKLPFISAFVHQCKKTLNTTVSHLPLLSVKYAHREAREVSQVWMAAESSALWFPFSTLFLNIRNS